MIHGAWSLSDFEARIRLQNANDVVNQCTASMSVERSAEVSIPRLSIAVSRQDLNVAILAAFQELGYDRPTKEQAEAVSEIIRGRDVLVILPTGGGKSLCFITLPLIFDNLVQAQGNRTSIVVVVSPLVSLMKDQVRSYSKKGVRCAFIGEDMEGTEIRAVLNGEYQVVYASPESFLTIPRWRDMLSTEVYAKNLVAVAVDEAHCVDTW